MSVLFCSVIILHGRDAGGFGRLCWVHLPDESNIGSQGLAHYLQPLRPGIYWRLVHKHIDHDDEMIWSITHLYNHATHSENMLHVFDGTSIRNDCLTIEKHFGVGYRRQMYQQMIPMQWKVRSHRRPTKGCIFQTEGRNERIACLDCKSIGWKHFDLRCNAAEVLMDDLRNLEKGEVNLSRESRTN